MIELKEANRFGHFDFSPFYFSSLVYERASHLASDPTKKEELLTKARINMEQAIARKPEKPLFYSWEALIYHELDDTHGYRTALEMTIRYNPVEGIDEYEQLALLYNQEKEYAKVIALAHKVLPYYPLDLYTNPYWVNPDKETIWKHVADIYEQLGIAYTKTGDAARAKEARETGKHYDLRTAPS
jgi:tetratricopeptide (TPR) repeat protein